MSATGWTVNDERLVFHADSHRYTLGERELPSVTTILKAVGIADFTGPWFTTEVRDRGAMVHQAIALDVDDALDETTLDAELLGYVQGFRAFIAESGAVIEHWERPICDPHSWYAGTLDGIVLLPQRASTPTRRTVLDVKAALYPSAGVQVAAYARCARALYDGPTIFNRAALVLDGAGGYKFQFLTDPEDELTFLAALRVYHFRQRHGLEAA